MGRLLWFGRGPANVGYWTDPAAATDSPSIGISQADPQQTSRAEVESSQSPSVQNAEARALAVAYGMQPIAGRVHDR